MGGVGQILVQYLQDLEEQKRTKYKINGTATLSSRTNAIWITVCGKSGLLRVHTYERTDPHSAVSSSGTVGSQ